MLKYFIVVAFVFCLTSGVAAQEELSLFVDVAHCVSLDSAALEQATFRLEPEGQGPRTPGVHYDVRVEGQVLVLTRVLGEERQVLRREPTSTSCETLLSLLSALIALDRAGGELAEPGPESLSSGETARPPATNEAAVGLPSPGEFSDVALPSAAASSAEPSAAPNVPAPTAMATASTADAPTRNDPSESTLGNVVSQEQDPGRSSEEATSASGSDDVDESPRSFLAEAPRFELAAGALLDVFGLPSPSPAIFASVGMGFASLSIDVRFVATTDRQDPLPDEQLTTNGWVEMGGPTDLDTYALHARACVATRFGLRGCVGVGTTLYRLREFDGYPIAIESRAFNPTFDALFSLSYRNSRLVTLNKSTGLGLDIGVDLIPHLVRPHFVKQLSAFPDREYLPQRTNVQVHVGLILAVR